MPVWLQVALAVVAPASALAGVWLGGRLSAGEAEEQWRRDRLLQFCSDLIAACHEVIATSGHIHDATRLEDVREPPYPHEAVQRMQLAIGSIRLLSDQLADPAHALGMAAMEVLGTATKSDEGFSAAHNYAGEVEGRFQQSAYYRLRAVPQPWWRRFLRPKKPAEFAA